MGIRDFRSDTVTRPTPAMLAAMAGAELGDDVLDGDPTVARLERAAAAWLGKDGALFVPSGTMANQCAIGSWTRPGDELIVERSAHVVQWESGAAAANHGVQTLTLQAEDGAFALEDLRSAFRPKSFHCPRQVLVCVEQSFMGSGAGPGGRVLPRAKLEQIAELCGQRGLAIHMDGARLANAVVASGVGAADWARMADSVSLCFSKGLGAPVGSVIAGDEEFLERARLVRKRLGGWMRQAGMLAAAALYALENHVERLAQDYENARELAARLDELPGLSCPPDEVETNIVMVRIDDERLDAQRMSTEFERHGVRVMPMNDRALRFVTHLDVGAEDVAAVREAAERILGLSRAAR